MEDVIRQLGFLCLGSRLKRLGERFQADTQRLLDELEISVQSGQHVFLAALDRLGPTTVGELAKALGVTQPGVTRSLATLVRLKLVTIHQTSDDRRQKMVGLTKKGQWLVDCAKQDIWPHVEKSVRNLCTNLPSPFLDQLTMIEDRLAAKPLYRRAQKNQGKKGRPA